MKKVLPALSRLPLSTAAAAARQRKPRTVSAGRRRGLAAVEPVEQRVLFAVFTVMNLNDAGAGSLRQAIIDSNATPTERDDITFTVTSGTINLLSQLPTVTSPVRIDTTQPDLTTPIIELNGVNAGPTANGLVITSDPLAGDVVATEVVGLAINRFNGDGVVITGDFNLLDTCFIGTNASTTGNPPVPALPALGNAGRGAFIQGQDNVIGNSTIAYNGGDGVVVATIAATPAADDGNDVGVNSIFANGGQAIDLGDNGPTPNDAGDADEGANRLQNFPVLSAVTFTPTSTTVSGTSTSTPNTGVFILFYANNTANREGRVFLDAVEGVTDAAGNFNFSNVALPAAPAVPAGATPYQWLTSTATAFTDEIVIGTSEFSAPVTSFAAPRVTQVWIRNSDSTAAGWAPAFRAFVNQTGAGSSENGFAIPGGAAQLDEMPWTNINQVRIQFSENVDVDIADLAVRGVNVANYALNAAGFSYDANTFTATWTLTNAVSNDRILLDLDGSNTDADGNNTAVDDVIGAAVGNLLDGEWTNGVSNYPSGNGAAGGDFRFQINLLPGDVNRNGGIVNSLDVQAVRLRQFTSPSNQVINAPNAYTIFHDVNGNALINALDLQQVRIRQFTELPVNNPTIVAGAGRTSPGLLAGLSGIFGEDEKKVLRR